MRRTSQYLVGLKKCQKYLRFENIFDELNEYGAPLAGRSNTLAPLRQRCFNFLVPPLLPSVCHNRDTNIYISDFLRLNTNKSRFHPSLVFNVRVHLGIVIEGDIGLTSTTVPQPAPAPDLIMSVDKNGPVTSAKNFTCYELVSVRVGDRAPLAAVVVKKKKKKKSAKKS